MARTVGIDTRKREIKENRIAHLKEEGRTVEQSSVIQKQISENTDLEHLGEHRAAGRVLLQTLTILSRGYNLILYLSFYEVDQIADTIHALYKIAR